MPRKRPLSDHDIFKFTRGLPHFRGVFMRDTLPKSPWKRECGVINLDDFVGAGTHWTAYRKINSQVWYFDSFGNLRPPIEVKHYFKGCTIFYNHDSFQSYDTTNCGQLCLNFLYMEQPDLVWKNE